LVLGGEGLWLCPAVLGPPNSEGPTGWAQGKRGKGREARHEGTGLRDREGASNAECRNPGNCAFYGWNAEGEIRTPEGLAAHQISSLARWTGLRYLSGSPSPEPGNTFSPPRRDDRNGATSSSKATTGWTSV